MTEVVGIARFGLNVSDLVASARFFEEGLGFAAEAVRNGSAAACALFGVRAMRTQRVRLGGQAVELAQFDPPGAPYPRHATAADLVFQHFAIVTPDIDAAWGRVMSLQPDAISRSGPVHLPARSGGVTAWKFRDHDGHPLELIQFGGARPAGVDHSALSVADADASIAFYAALGLRVASRQVNVGPEQDRLDGLENAEVDVVALAPTVATPHVELLGYRRPRGRPARRDGPTAIAATRIVLDVSAREGAKWGLQQDPDGHFLLSAAPGQDDVETSAT